MAITAPASRQEAIAPRRLATGSTDHRCKWIALSDATIGVLMVAMNASIVPIALPDVFRGITLCRWPDPVASTLSWWPGQLWSRLYVMSYQILHVHPPPQWGRAGRCHHGCPLPGLLLVLFVPDIRDPPRWIPVHGPVSNGCYRTYRSTPRATRVEVRPHPRAQEQGRELARDRCSHRVPPGARRRRCSA